MRKLQVIIQGEPVINVIWKTNDDRGMPTTMWGPPVMWTLVYKPQ